MRGLDIKAEATRARIPLYLVAAEARINPSELSRLLNERKPMAPLTGDKILAAIRRLAGVEE